MRGVFNVGRASELTVGAGQAGGSWKWAGGMRGTMLGFMGACADTIRSGGLRRKECSWKLGF